MAQSKFRTVNSKILGAILTRFYHHGDLADGICAPLTFRASYNRTTAKRRRLNQFRSEHGENVVTQCDILDKFNKFGLKLLMKCHLIEDGTCESISIYVEILSVSLWASLVRPKLGKKKAT